VSTSIVTKQLNVTVPPAVAAGESCHSFTDVPGLPPPEACVVIVGTGKPPRSVVRRAVGGGVGGVAVLGALTHCELTYSP